MATDKQIDSFLSDLRNKLENKEALNKRSLEKLGNKYGLTDKTLIKEVSELAIVMQARSLIGRVQQFPQYHLPAYRLICDLYSQQYNLSLRTSHSMMLQQYSTPAPIAFLASSYVRGNGSGLYFEPSAGNGLLTIALPYQETYVNELDDVRLSNLKRQPFAKVTRQDATKPFKNYQRKFDGVVTNPPFGTLSQPIIADGYKIKHLDHAMAIIALDTMKDNGKSAIIIGGHSKWDEHGRLQKGKNRIFLNYLYHHYNVEDVILIDGHKLYSKQGTSFDVRLILINGRKKIPDGFAPLKNEKLSKVVTSFEELWDRVGLDQHQGQNKYKQRKLQQKRLRAKAILILQKQVK